MGRGISAVYACIALRSIYVWAHPRFHCGQLGADTVFRNCAILNRFICIVQVDKTVPIVFCLLDSVFWTGNWWGSQVTSSTFSELKTLHLLRETRAPPCPGTNIAWGGATHNDSLLSNLRTQERAPLLAGADMRALQKNSVFMDSFSDFYQIKIELKIFRTIYT